MRILSILSVLLALAAGGAQAPSTTDDAWTPDARLVYESDTRAYYRPCG
jgi:hypothetical protein